MVTRHTGGRATARGSALLIALIFLVLFASMAVAIAASSDINLSIARNRVAAHQAAALAETGLLLLQRNLGGLAVPATSDAEDLHTAVSDHLADSWYDSSMLDAPTIWANAEGVQFPTITLIREDGRSGTISLSIVADGGATAEPTIVVESTGRFDNAVRTVYYQMGVIDSFSVLANYGIASKSRIFMQGSPTIQGASSTTEGSIFSATASRANAIELGGNASVTGHAAVSSSTANIVTSGSSQIGGDRIYGALEPPWPTVDVSVFRDYATNVYTDSPGGGGGSKGKGKGGGDDDQTLTNILIPAGTNPTFNGNTTLTGVIYIESPNVVTFNGNADVTGIIVAEQPETENFSLNKIRFNGNVEAQGVEYLPVEFNDLRGLTGSLILAPGYKLDFSGNASDLGGWVVGSVFEFTGNVRAHLRGGVLGLADSDFNIHGNLTMTIDKSGMPQTPAGMRPTYRLVGIQGSYTE